LPRSVEGGKIPPPPLAETGFDLRIKEAAPTDASGAFRSGPRPPTEAVTWFFQNSKRMQVFKFISPYKKTQKGINLSKTSIQKEATTFLGAGSEFEGKLVFDGTVQVEGKLVGQVQSQGTFIIGEKALVRAEIQAGIVLVRGEVHGTITARTRIEAYAPAKIFGVLSSPVLVFGEGILFQGTSHMIPVEESEKDAKPFPTGPTEIGP